MTLLLQVLLPQSSAPLLVQVRVPVAPIAARVALVAVWALVAAAVCYRPPGQF